MKRWAEIKIRQMKSMTEAEEKSLYGTTTTKTTNMDAVTTGNIEIVAKIDRDNPALSCATFQESGILAVGWSDGSIEVRNSQTYEELSFLESPSGMPATSLSAFTSNDAKEILLASYASGETVLWDAEEAELLSAAREDRQCLANDFNNDYTCYAVGGSDARISVYDTETQKLVQVLQGSMDPDVMDGHTMRIFATRFHPERKYQLVSGGWDDTVQFWDIREPFSRRKIRGPHICGDGIEFLDDDKIITASWRKNKSLQVWDFGTGNLIENIKPDAWSCFLYFSRNINDDEGILLTGGSHRNMLKVIDINSRRTMATIQNLDGAVYFAEENPDHSLDSFTKSVCFCSNSSLYIAEIAL